MKPCPYALATCLVLSSIFMVPYAYAQFGAGGGMGGGMSGGGRHGSGERPKAYGSGEKSDATKGPPINGPQAPMSREQLEYHLGTLEVDLRLNPTQTAAWQTFADRILALQADMERQRGRNNAVTAVSALPSDGIKTIATAVDSTRNRLTALEDIESSGRALYQALQAEQKLLVDLRMGTFLMPLLRG